MRTFKGVTNNLHLIYTFPARFNDTYEEDTSVINPFLHKVYLRFSVFMGIKRKHWEELG